MVDRFGQFQVAKVARVRLFVQITETRIVGASVDGLTVDHGLIAGHTRWNLAAIDRDRLRHTVLALYRCD